ncbi:hypothetical protein A7981_00435 [Methylovorus sp. MM2]|uniref:STAS-like domain-containing protein n=1 Tax=Methylovorus sp. MM2 TaxID=1848038 RepID=UPI0007E0BC84|nr:STAS-like domain-containing protein [Methylovorus sp. MM2]OAM51997.1 hypothetical protein A7981_00435 [Methylovorus sp. MM2]
MDNIQIHIDGTDLSSRKTAAVVRQKILLAVSEGKTISIDLSDVHSISESYADEAFGVIVASQGLNWLVKNVQFQSEKDAVIKSIASAINRRLKNLNLKVSEAIALA